MLRVRIFKSGGVPLMKIGGSCGAYLTIAFFLFLQTEGSSGAIARPGRAFLLVAMCYELWIFNSGGVPLSPTNNHPQILFNINAPHFSFDIRIYT
jgi:hypothetical protein